MPGENNTQTAGEQEKGSNLSSDAKNIVMATSILNSLPEGEAAVLMESPELKGLEQILKKSNQNGGANGSGEENGADGADGTDSSKGSEGSEGADGTDGADGSEDEDSIFFGGKKPADKIKVPQFKTVEEVQAFAKKTFKTENIGEVFASAKEAQKIKGELEATNSKLQQFQEFFLKVPEPLFEALELAESGKDWKAPLLALDSKVDFSKPYEQNNELDIVQKYFPSISAEDYAKKADNPLVQRSIELAKQQFATDAKRVSTDREKISQGIENRNKALKASVDVSLVSLQKKYPGLKPAEIQKVQKMMVTGEYKNLFLNPDGTFSEEAASAIAMAVFGDTEIKKLLGKKSTEHANKTIEDTVSRGADKVKDKGGKGNPGNESQMAGTDKGVMNMLRGYFSNTSTYGATPLK